MHLFNHFEAITLLFSQESLDKFEAKPKIKASSLDQVNPGETVTVRQVATSDSSLGRKLASMGIVSGGKLEVLGRAPLGCPISISTMGYQLSLRLSEASSIRVDHSE